jgi:hypothetical protein
MQMASIVLPKPGADQRQGASLGHEGGIEVAQDDLPFEFRAKPEIELRDRGGKRKPRLPQAPLSGRTAPRGHLVFEQSTEEVGRAQFFLGGAVEPGREHGGGVLEVQRGEQCNRRRHRTPSGNAASIST